MVALDFVIPKAILKRWFKTQVILAPMTPEQIELVVRRLMALGAPKESFCFGVVGFGRTSLCW